MYIKFSWLTFTNLKVIWPFCFKYLLFFYIMKNKYLSNDFLIFISGKQLFTQFFLYIIDIYLPIIFFMYHW